MINQNKMTAVEQLIDQLTSVGVLEIPQGSNVVTYIIKQAKEMEREQREEDLESGFDTGRLYQGREGDTTLGQLKSKTFKSE